MNKEEKGCLCMNKKHNLDWHCIIRPKHDNGSKPDIIRADFPFANPKTEDTGDWTRNKFHLIKNWGKKNESH